MSKGNYKPKKKHNKKNIAQQPIITNTKNTKKKMVFNTLFSIIVLLGSLLMFAFGIINAIAMTPETLLMAIGAMIVTIFCASTAVQLIRKNRMGYKLAIIYNWLHIFGAVFATIMSILVICFEEYILYFWLVLGYVGGANMLMFTVPALVFHIIALMYYKKKRDIFV